MIRINVLLDECRHSFTDLITGELSTVNLVLAAFRAQQCSVEWLDESHDTELEPEGIKAQLFPPSLSFSFPYQTLKPPRHHTNITTSQHHNLSNSNSKQHTQLQLKEQHTANPYKTTMTYKADKLSDHEEQSKWGTHHDYRQSTATSRSGRKGEGYSAWTRERPSEKKARASDKKASRGGATQYAGGSGSKGEYNASSSTSNSRLTDGRLYEPAMVYRRGEEPRPEAPHKDYKDDHRRRDGY